MKNTLRVLIIEDNESLLLLLNHYLGKRYEVHSAKNGLDAMSKMSSGLIPDVILLDWNMPIMDGKKFLEGIHSSSFYKNIPIIIISGSKDYEQLTEKIEIAHSFYKPFNPKVLNQKIEELFISNNQI